MLSILLYSFLSHSYTFLVRYQILPKQNLPWKMTKISQRNSMKVCCANTFVVFMCARAMFKLHLFPTTPPFLSHFILILKLPSKIHMFVLKISYKSLVSPHKIKHCSKSQWYSKIWLVISLNSVHFTSLIYIYIGKFTFVTWPDSMLM